MSVAEMQQFVAESIGRIADPAKLEKMVELIGKAVESAITVDELWSEITSKHDDVMHRLAE